MLAHWQAICFACVNFFLQSFNHICSSTGYAVGQFHKQQALHNKRLATLSNYRCYRNKLIYLSIYPSNIKSPHAFQWSFSTISIVKWFSSVLSFLPSFVLNRTFGDFKCHRFFSGAICPSSFLKINSVKSTTKKITN